MTENKDSSSLPRLARWLLARIVRFDDFGFAEGDLSEIFAREAATKGKLSAWLWIFSETLRSFPAFIRTNMIWGLIMLKNYLKVTLRNVKRFKGYTFINIAGLSIGLTCSIFILTWVRGETNYDRFHENSSDIYRIYLEGRYADAQVSAFLSTPGPLAPALKAEIPEIIDTSRYLEITHALSRADKHFTMEGCFVDPSFLEMFTFPSLNKNAKTEFSDPNSIVLTKKAAERLFGDKMAEGETVQVRDWFDLKVSGIVADIPENSHIQFDFLLPFILLENLGLNLEDWHTQNYTTYVQLQGSVPVENVIAKAQNLYLSHWTDSSYTMNFQPLTQIHLRDYRGGGPINSVYIFMAAAIFILLIACINFINLSTARSLVRAKEVGMRKTIGAHRGQIVKQFVLESLFFAFLSYGLAVILIRIFQPFFSILAGKPLDLNFLDHGFILGSMVMILLIGLGAGLYPAFLLSSFKPADVLKGTHRSGSSGSILRKGLVIFQFSISILLLVCVLIVLSQLGFIKHKDLGLGRENVVSFRMTGNLSKQYNPLKAEILENPDVSSVTRISNLPIRRRSSTDGVSWEGKQDADQKILMHTLFVDSDFCRTFDVKISEGEFFSATSLSDKFQGFVVNQTAVSSMGLESPIGKTMEAWGLRGQILGVVQDFHFRSIRNPIEAMILVEMPSEYSILCAKIVRENQLQTLAFLEEKIRQFDPGYSYGFQFLEEEIDNLYKAEQSGSRILGSFTVLAVFISCLGLFGLALFLTERRTKEIGIKRILGASVFNLIWQLTKDFSKWVLLANLFAWPVAYLSMIRWLQEYAFRTPIRLWIFFTAAALTLVIAILTVSYQAIKAARTNPVNSLRYE